MPRLSVVVPAYGVEAYLPECLESILAEPVPGLEVVVVDDHSPDRSGEIADRYARRDPRVRVLHLAANVGLGRARNAGLERAGGAYLWFVDGDDWLPAGAVAAVAARLAATRPDVLAVDHVEVFPDGRIRPGTPAGVLAGVPAPAPGSGSQLGPAPGSGSRSDPEPGPLGQRPQLLRLAHSACTKVVRRDLLNELDLRFPPGWYEDSGYTHPLLLAAARIDVLDRVCYAYRRRGAGAITGSVSPRHFEVFAQYARMWGAVDAAGGRHERFRPDLFRVMVDHLLVIAGNDHRLPARLRREFFRRLVREYRDRLPAGGYPVPGGLAGLKHRLVRWNAYRPYAALRLGRRVAGRLRTAVHPAPATAPPTLVDLVVRQP